MSTWLMTMRRRLQRGLCANCGQSPPWASKAWYCRQCIQARKKRRVKCLYGHKQRPGVCKDCQDGRRKLYKYGLCVHCWVRKNAT